MKCNFNNISWQRCCVFWPAFGCCTPPKAGRKTFFISFQPYLFILMFSSDFSHAIKKKRRFACQPALESSLKHCFSTVFSWFQAKITENFLRWTNKDENGKIVFLPAFLCKQHPKAGQNTQHKGKHLNKAKEVS